MNYAPVETRCLLALLASALTDKAIVYAPEHVNWETLYSLSNIQRVTGIIYYGMFGSTLQPDEEWKEKFGKRFQAGVTMHDMQTQELNNILLGLEAKQIKSMLLNDFVLKDFYPQRDMRLTDCLEFLVGTKKDRQLDEMMQLLGYERKKNLEYDCLIYEKSGSGQVLFYKKLLCSSQKMQRYFSSLWKRAYLKEDYTSVYEMCWEDFYLFLICDLADAYALGDANVRSIADLWLFCRHFADTLNWTYIELELKSMDLFSFSESMKQLGKIWIERSASNDPDLYQELERYIMTNGATGGEASRSILPLIEEIEEWNRKKTRRAQLLRTLQWLFPDKHYMQSIYPSAGSVPIVILPIYWMIRLVQIGYKQIREKSRRQIRRFLKPLLLKLHSWTEELLNKDTEE